MAGGIRISLMSDYPFDKKVAENQKFRAFGF